MNYKRVLIYFAAIIILALGLTLNTKIGLGTSSTVCMADAASKIFHWSLGDATLAEYIVFILIQVVIHLWKKVDKKVLLLDVLQFPFVLVFSRFVNLFAANLPSLVHLPIYLRLLVLFIAIMLIALGASTMMSMNMIPNPRDGILLALALATGKDVGLMKNCFDVACVSLAIIMSLLAHYPITSVGIGTICCVIGIGRFIHLFNQLFQKKLLEIAEIQVS